MGPAWRRRWSVAPKAKRFGFELEPVDAYGDRNPELIQRVTRKMLAEHAGADATFEPGDLVEFAAPNGGAIRACSGKSTTSPPCSISTILSRACACAWTWRCWECCDEEARYRRQRRGRCWQPRLLCRGGSRHRHRRARVELHGAPIYVRHEIVHNRYVVEDLRAKGAVFIDELEDARGRHRGVLGPRRVTRPCAPKPTPVACRCSTPPARW